MNTRHSCSISVGLDGVINTDTPIVKRTGCGNQSCQSLINLSDPNRGVKIIDGELSQSRTFLEEIWLIISRRC